jgi:hypothetical protein
MPYYNNYIDQEDDNVIVLESSVESDIDSQPFSPEINNSSVIEMLKNTSLTPKPDDKSTNNDYRYSLRGFFRSLSWRSKNSNNIQMATDETDEINQAKEKDDAKEDIDNIKYKTSAIRQENILSMSSNDLKQSNLNQKTESDKSALLDILYDNTKPMEFLPENDLDYISMNHNSLYKVDSNATLQTTVKNEHVEKTFDKSDFSIPKSSSLKKFSLFSRRSKSTPTEKSKSSNDIISSASKAGNEFDDLILLSKWRMPEYNLPELIPNYKSLDPDFKNKSQNKIYLFLENVEDKKSKQYFQEKNEQEKNIEDFFYYPLTKSLINKYFSQNFDHQRKEKMEFSPKLLTFSKNNNVFRSESDKVEDRNSKISIKKFNFNNIIAGIKENEKESFQKFSNLNIEYKRFLELNDISGLREIQTENKLGNMVTNWNLWIVDKDKSKTRKTRCQLFTKITNISEIFELQNNVEIVDYYVQNKNKFVYVIRDNEKSVFHGKLKIRKYGEYVFIIPIFDAEAVWNCTIFLLLTEKLITNFANYNLIGISWRGFWYKKEYGYHLTLLVEDRSNFNETRLLSFLSEFASLIPDGLGKHFQKCKTLYPGEKKATVVNIV